jgi:hypothetical protein
VAKVRNKPTVTEELSDLSRIDEIDEMLIDGTAPTDVARFIQGTLGHLKKVNEDSLVKALRHRKAAKAQILESTTAAAQTASMVSSKYAKAVAGLDHLIELESMYLLMKQRISRSTKLEEDGEYLENLYRDFNCAKDIVVDHAKLMTQMGLGNRVVETEGSSVMSERISKVLERPESRRKILSVIEQLRSLGEFAEPAIEAAE